MQNAAKVSKEPILLKNSVFDENRIFFRLREPQAFGCEGVGQLGLLRLLYRRRVSAGRSILTFGVNGPRLKNHRFQISEFFNKISPECIMLQCVANDSFHETIQ